MSDDGAATPFVDLSGLAGPSCSSGIPPAALKYAAGHPDRLLQGRFFQSVVIKESWSKLFGVNGDLSYGHAASDRKEVKTESWTSLRSRLVKGGAAGIDFAPRPLSKSRSKATKFSSWLLDLFGVLYYDRLRYRSAGQVVGERIYTLGLAPGEQVNLSQRSETRLSRSLENVTTREEELNASLSSHLSTDLTGHIAHTNTTTIGGNLGVNAGASAPDFFNAGGDAAGSISNSDTLSSDTQTKYAYELSSEIARKSREEHKTTFKVGSEQVNEFGSKRTIVNRNHSRSLMLNMFKVYNKQHVTLERYDSKLALNLVISNAVFGDLIERLQAAIGRLDPDDPSNYQCQAPAGAVRKTIAVRIDCEDPGDVLSYLGGTWQFSQIETLTPPAGLVFSAASGLRLKRWQVKKSDGTRYNAPPEDYAAFGGRYFLNEHGPAPLVPGAHTAGIQAWAAKGFGGPLTPGAWWTSRLEFEYDVQYVTDPAVDQQYRTCIDSERRRLRQNLSPDHVAEVVAANLGSLRDHIFLRLIQKYFLPLLPTSQSAQGEFLVREFRHYFDWNEAVVEQIPGWMDGSDRDAFDRLTARIRALVPSLDPTRILPAELDTSAVQVYLPVRAAWKTRSLNF